MCETYAGRVDNLDYKSLRYPGHAALMNFFFHELLMREDRDAAGRVLTYAKPPVDDDVVYLHVAAEGWADGRLDGRNSSASYYPIEIGGRLRTAIAWTTAGSAAAVIEMAQSGALPGQGFLKRRACRSIPSFRRAPACFTRTTGAVGGDRWPACGLPSPMGRRWRGVAG